MKRLLGLVKPLAGHMTIAIVMGVIGHLMAAFIPILGGFAVLNILGYDTPFDLTITFILMVAFALIRAVLHYLEQNRNHFIAFTLLAIIRDKVFGALRRLCPAKLEGRDKGDLIAMITTDIELLEVFYAHTISPIFIATIFSIIMVIFIGSYNVILGMIAAAAYAVVGIAVPLIVSKMSGSTGTNMRGKAADLSSYVLDGLRGLPEVQQFGAGQRRIDGVNQRTESLNASAEKMNSISSKNAAITNAIILCFDMIMLIVAAALMKDGTIGFDAVIICTLALMSSFGPVAALAGLGSTLQTTIASGNRVLDVLDEEPIIQDITGKQPVEFNGMEVKDVSFAYGSEKVLENVSLDIPNNRIVGIMGRSGSGKSTLLKLMMRFWKINDGEIDISGTSVEDINTTDLRNMESYVTQDTHLFHDSIRNNIRIAKLDATDEEIIEACKKAAVHDFIMTLPKGYDTPVGELGDTLSGGEKQRIGLARAFLHNSSLMLLDEPTSNLDSLNESIILRSLKEERGDRTIVLISHRESTLRIADEKYLVDNGRVS